MVSVFINFCRLVIVSLGVVSVSFASNNSFNIVIAGEMPDISRQGTANYSELKQLILDTQKHNQNTFFIFGGRSIGPSALGSFDRGAHIIDLLNTLEPDAMGISKRDFSYFEEQLTLRSYEALFPFVASNLLSIDNFQTLDGLESSALLQRKDFTLGFISVLDELVVSEYLLTKVSLLDAEKVIRQKSKELKSAGADFIVLHFFEHLSSIEQLLNDGVVDLAFVSNSEIHSSVRPKLENNQKILLFDDSHSAIVSTVDIDTENAPLITSKTIDLRTHKAHTETQKQVESYLQRINRLLDDPIGYWETQVSTQTHIVRSQENIFGNFIVNAMLDFTQADIALINSGSIRGNKVHLANDIVTRRTIANELPFRSTLIVVSITGKDLLEALNIGFQALDKLKGAFPQVAGMKIKYDSRSKTNNRIKSVTIGGKPLDLEQTYLLATTDYLAQGGDGYVAFKRAVIHSESSIKETILISDLVLRKLRLNGKIDAPIEGRITDIGTAQ